jgi:hypothetical protein
LQESTSVELFAHGRALLLVVIDVLREGGASPDDPRPVSGR